MRVLYIDIDTLRPDHLGCYGYHRETSPNIDTFASGALQFNNVHASDVPCLPSRTALLTGRFGIHNGVVNHGGTDADPAIEGESRGFWSRLHMTSFPNRLKRAGLKTVSISSFAQRHSAFHWYSGFDEAYDVGKYGLETADEVWAITDDWLTRNGKADDWFLHVHMWDPHTPYRAPAEFGEPFADDPLPSWLTEDVRAKHWQSCGPHSAREANGFAPKPEMLEPFPRQPQEIPDLQAVRQMFDGYDTGVLMSDHYVGQIFNKLADLNIDSDTVIMLSSDHGETLGELNVYGDHQTADQITTRVPLLLHWPGIENKPGIDNTNKPLNAFHYQIDVSATILDLLGQRVPSNWDGKSFAEALHRGRDEGRDYLVVSQGAWACQRGIRYDDYIYINTRHDAYHLYPDAMLFDVVNDPHQTNNLATSKPEVLARGKDLLATWLSDNAPYARGRDPHDNVMAEGGPFHVRGQLEDYLTRLRATDRSHCADELAAKWS
ncbi:MAG: sulfatase-like hydrolase/transferase [Pseudomonadales bacterium]|nr:sulfatase-like hydrolase/transferase [Pseudomonadales bacterium]